MSWNKDEVVFLALDTATNATGWALYVNGLLFGKGIISVHKENNKLESMGQKLLSLLHLHEPDIVVLETPVVNRNVQVQRNLSKLTGIVYGWCLFHHVDYQELRPTEWRALVGIKQGRKKREELKQESIQLIKEKLNIEVTDDIADAILIGQAYINLIDSKGKSKE